jgi:hypothetical protein
MQYYTLSPENHVGGPYTAASMLEMQEAGILTAETLTAAAGDTGWQPFSDLLPAVQEDRDDIQAPLNPGDFHEQVHAARKSGPPTLPVLARLLQEDASFPRPRKKQTASRR